MPAATSTPATWETLELAEAASMPSGAVLSWLGSTEDGLGAVEVRHRLQVVGPNAIVSHGARSLQVLLRQFRNPLLLLLLGAAAVSIATGDRTNPVIILVIVLLSVGLGFVNEYRSQRAVEDLHSSIRHSVIVVRDAKASSIDVTGLVPGDLVHLDVGDVIPADLRLLEANDMECDEAVLTGESLPAPKSADPVENPGSSLDLGSCAFMGTVVRAGTGRGIVVLTGQRTAFGRIARGLEARPPETAFQQGLHRFSLLLIRVTAVLTISIFVINAALRRPLLEAALFSLAIAVGLTPQLLPAIVTVSLSTGARVLARKKVVVKRLVSIEDLGNIELLFTDKTGTLTEGRLAFSGGLDAAGAPSAEVAAQGLACNSVVLQDGRPVGGNPLDRALWLSPQAPHDAVSGFRRLAEIPFDYDRRLMSVVVEAPGGGRLLITKGAPESVLDRCPGVGEEAREVLDGLFSAGNRVVAVATRDASGLARIGPEYEQGLELSGFLTFVDPLKEGARDSLQRLRSLGIRVKVVTGDNAQLAARVCTDLGMEVGGTLSGAEIDHLDDAELGELLADTTVFARVSPEQKSRIIKVQRGLGVDVAFLGDGVNDAVALHDADVGISVDSAADVAKDAADIIMLEKDLGVLADGVVEGRRIFANTIKYVLMGTSSSFGNMFSAAGASLFLSFLPMLPSQILLNNVLYDAGEMAIPADNVDEEMLRRPSYWDTRFIRRFMSFFGPISSIYDFMTFGVMLAVFHAGETLFHTAWFVESLATQSLVIFVIRTRRVPFLRSRPHPLLLWTTLLAASLGMALPFIGPLARLFGFTPLPGAFLGILVAMVATYLLLVELGKRWFFLSRCRVHALRLRCPTAAAGSTAWPPASATRSRSAGEAASGDEVGPALRK